MEEIIDGKKTNVEIIGSFEVEELGKSYALCSYDDEDESDKALVVILEMEGQGDAINLVSIPDEEKEMVMYFYQNFKKKYI